MYYTSEVTIPANGTVAETMTLNGHGAFSIIAIETDSNWVAGTLTPTVSTQNVSIGAASATFKPLADQSGSNSPWVFTLDAGTVHPLDTGLMVATFVRFTASATQTSGTRLRIHYMNTTS